ncbi:trypsin-like peptidase domain-containing protein [Phaeodactylibacter sp.]|jgi:S1-C subfamily serine protease|uniref:S1C family serine protease n=1 Tax=Phaeodactylibacter sp. TaxID=1940289 RepID=UPI0025DC3768|nr:trypsin-like peptidase domain-containing protein [Phaeodactylibacter sp.]MCI4650930.1 trypsin-like peptidase domain-containing protein [Phaeodactylibacter sp.]MCI5094207.1 trypsin-like peptidase domain-containing protein [Phaeodactylibacter sp.]
MKSVIQNIFIAVVSAACTFMFMQQFYHLPQPMAQPVATAQPVLTGQEPSGPIAAKEAPINQRPRAWAEGPIEDFVSTSKLVTSAVVNINTLSASGYRVSSGSGVIIATDGYIITNHHVVEDGATYEITMYDKRKLEAELIGSDPTTDLALLKVDTRGLKPVLYGDSDKVEVGQWVLAVGNPFNLSSTVTAGIVSAKARNINILRGSYSIESFIQTDAVVNPGNSGGALVNEKGELIGINTAIISESGGYEGYSFAIPANLVRKVVRDIREFGEVQRAILGVGIAEVTGEIAQQQALPGVAGVYINSVSQGSSAAEAGIREGDVIITINNVKTNSVPELQEQIALFRPGDKISLEFYRQGQKFRRDNVVLQSLSEAGSR